MTSTLPTVQQDADPAAGREPEIVPETAPAEPESRTRLPHVGALDGLRGVAVLAVVVYHLNSELLPGGFLGVSVFFTLSGFLITNLLLTEWKATRAVRLRHFWGRRFRRLLPAAVLGLAVVTVTAWLWADATQLESLRGDVLAALGYVANWRFIVDGDMYGAGFEQPSPVLHFWSLAIEEQFYIVVALIAVALARWARRKRTWFITFGALAAMSMLATVVVGSSGDTNRVYFGSDTRAFELLVGVLLALVIGFSVPQRLMRHVHRHVVVCAAAVAVIAAFILVDTSEPLLYRGGLWIFALGSAALILGALDNGPINWALSWRPLAALGLISYGVYVYHWPIFVFVSDERTGLDGVGLAVLRIGLTLVLAIGSYRLLEQPIRERRLHVRPALVGAIAIGTVAVLAAGTTILDGQSKGRSVVDTPDLELSMPAASAAPPLESVTQTALLPPVKRVLFLGDSLIHQSWPTLEARMATAGIDALAIGDAGEHLLVDDGAWLEQLDQAITEFDPDVVVLEACCGWGTPWKAERVRAPDGTLLRPDTDASWAEWSRTAAAVTDLVRDRQRVALWILAPPARTNGYYGPIEGRIGVANDIYRVIARCRPGLGLVDWRVIAGPDGGFVWELPDRSGQPVRVRHDDGLHFSPEGQAVLADRTVQAVKTQWATAGGRGPAPAPTCAP